MLDTFFDWKITGAGKSNNEVMDVFTQTEFDHSSETEKSPNNTFMALHGYFSNPENFAHKPVTYFSSLKFDTDGEFFAKNDR